MPYDRNIYAAPWTVTGTTYGAVGVCGLVCKGSSAASTLTLLDGTSIRIVVPIGVTAGFDYHMSYPVAFANLITDMTGTAGYTVLYMPRP